MKNKIKDISLFLIISLLLFLLVVVFMIINNRKIKTQEEIENASIEILGNKNDLIDFSISPLDEVEGVILATGSVSGGYFFEGNILINILDKNKNILREGYGNAKTDWMTSGPVGFDTFLDFSNLPKGLAFIEIQNDDPSEGEGGPAKKILIPVIIK